MSLSLIHIYGVWYCRYWDYTSEEFLSIIDGYEENDFPLDNLVFDMGWHTYDAKIGTGHAGSRSWTGYTWERKRIPDPGAVSYTHLIATSRRNRPTSHVADYKELYALLDGYNVRILSGHSHNNYTTTISETIEENTLGAVMGAYWNGEELCNDGSPRGYAVYEIEGNRIRNWYYKGTAFPREYQMYLYGPGEAVSEKYRDGLILNIFNWHTTWTVEVQEDNACLLYTSTDQ